MKTHTERVYEGKCLRNYERNLWSARYKITFVTICTHLLSSITPNEEAINTLFSMR